MANTYFQFKQFTIHQENCAMKVSTDAVVLGALATAENTDRILDIGAGTGVISLMLAQRFSTAKIDSVEIDQFAAKQAKENVAKSPWKERVQIHLKRFQNFAPSPSGQYPLIVSNPPYFTNHNKSLDQQRNLALHNDALSFGDLIKGVVKLLDKEKGKFWVILPPQQMKELEKVARFFHLYPAAFFELKDRSSTRVLRQIKAYSFLPSSSPEITILRIKNEDFSYSEEYRQLMKDFLLAF